LGATRAARTLQVHIDNATIFVNNTAGVEDARCPHTDGEKSEYCADGCTPVFGGGALNIGMATAGILLGCAFFRERGTCVAPKWR
jgi:hypothetical protein